ncbi:MAG TPA: MOSC domain-containing protein [Usitatibacteraceae bacterium]
MTALAHAGTVDWIGVRPGRELPMQVLSRAVAVADHGLTGDRTGDRARAGGKRQVTLIQAEHLDVIGRLLQRGAIDPALLRRNIVVAGISLLALKGQRFRIGEALLETTGECHPCSKMETQLGPGGCNAMRGHGGITAKVLQSGEISLGAALVPAGIAAGQP